MSKLLLILMLALNKTFVDTPSISLVRSLHQKALKEEKYCKELINLLKEYNENNQPLFFGYKGSATMMRAKYAVNPFLKLDHFNKGKKMLEKAITADENNIELRFLRLAAQTNSPSFLGYNDQISSDKSFLSNAVSTLTDTVLRKAIISYLRS